MTMATGVEEYKRYLREALDRANHKAETGPIFGAGNRRMYEGCAFAYEIALEKFQTCFESVDEDDPAVLRAEIVLMREQMAAIERSLRSAGDDIAYARRRLSESEGE
jgi:hypothetical protein